MKLEQDLQHESASGNSGPIINVDGPIRCVGMIENRGERAGPRAWHIELFGYHADFARHDECIAYMRGIQDVCNRVLTLR